MSPEEIIWLREAGRKIESDPQVMRELARGP